MAQYSTQTNDFLNNNNKIYEVVMTTPVAVPSVFVQGGNSNTGTDAFGRSRTSHPFTLFESSFRYTDSERKWHTKLTGTASSTIDSNNSLIDLTVGTASGDQVIRQTQSTFGYQPGKSLLVMNSFTLNTPKANLRQRVGYFTKQNGIFLEVDGTNVYIVKRSYGTGAVVDTQIAQSAWNGDPLNSNGASKLNLDIDASQIFWCDLEWLGVGSVRCGFVINGQFIVAHTFHHANSITGTYMTTGSLSCRYEITNTGETGTGSTLKQICSSVVSEGGYEDIGLTRSATLPIGGKALPKGAGNLDTPCVSLRLKGGRTDAVVIPRQVTVYGFQNTPFKWRLRRNCTLTNASWVTDDSASAVEYDLSADSAVGGIVLYEGVFKGQETLNPVNLSEIFNHSLQLTRGILDSDSAGDILAFTVEPTTNNDDVIVSVTWQEASS